MLMLEYTLGSLFPFRINSEAYRQLVGLLALGIKPDIYTGQHEDRKKWEIHAPSGIQTHDPSA
jgi:hypothetical protein